MATLQGIWVTSYVGWMHFDRPEPGVDGKTGIVDTYDEFIDRQRNLPPLIGGFRCVPRFQFGARGYALYTGQPVPPGRGGRILGAPRLPDAFEPREGYFAISGVISLKLDGAGNLTGVEQFNRGAASFKTNNITSGSYTSELDSVTTAIIGEIHTVHVNTGDDTVENVYAYVVRSDDELEWIAQTSMIVGQTARYKGRVAHGTFRRVRTTITP